MPAGQDGKHNEKKPHEKTALIEDEKAGEGSVSISVYKDYARAAGLHYYIILAILYMITYGASVGSNIWLSHWSNAAADDPDEASDKLDVYLGVYGALGGINAIGVLFVAITLALSAINASRSLHNKMLDCVVHAPMKFFDTTPLGRIVNRFAKDM